ncbi:GDSL-like lipase/acylhydrolase domain containing protein [Calothrix sp. NIES-2100]|uniref:GDSL-type esterase/lipase family protein n=1 Tax=Calothrix sp. NIES-2100 TaxID=1954172 RepID=UPI000B5DC238|nr:GDSL-like lipase/acylhydrolase domain containing protein [Calothrix sp. NIES-2100]
MKKLIKSFLLAAVVLTLHAAPLSSIYVFESETISGAGDLHRDDSSDRGRAYASNHRAWQPLEDSTAVSTTPAASARSPITVPTNGWFPPGWVSRRTAFRDSLAADQGAVVFFGDSITEGFKQDKAFPGLKTANRGISGDLARNISYRLNEDVIAVHPKAVILLIGCNDSKDGRPAEKIVADLRTAVETIHATLPDTTVIISRLMPRAPRPEQPQEAKFLPGAILKINKLIDAMPAQLPWLRLADPFTPMAQADGMPIRKFFVDGVHPNSAGYAKFTEALTPVLRAADVLPK